MCWAEKCCYFIPANLGCVLLGVISFILSAFLMATSISCYFLEDDIKDLGPLAAQPHPVITLLGFQLNKSLVHIILGVLIIVAILWMLFSILLVVGVTQNKPSMVVAFFSFGIILTILGQLSALLLLIQQYWIIALVLFIFSLIHIHYLVVVHTVYELMQRGKDFRFHLHRDNDEDPLADCFDQDLERI